MSAAVSLAVAGAIAATAPTPTPKPTLPHELLVRQEQHGRISVKKVKDKFHVEITANEGKVPNFDAPWSCKDTNGVRAVFDKQIPGFVLDHPGLYKINFYLCTADKSQCFAESLDLGIKE